MEFKTKFNLEDEAFIVQNGKTYRCCIDCIIVECDLRDFIIKYRVTKYLNNTGCELSDESVVIDENHLFAERDNTEIQIERALQMRNGRLD